MCLQKQFCELVWCECNFGRDCTLYFHKEFDMFLKFQMNKITVTTCRDNNTAAWLTHCLEFHLVWAVTLLPTLLNVLKWMVIKSALLRVTNSNAMYTTTAILCRMRPILHSQTAATPFPTQRICYICTCIPSLPDCYHWNYLDSGAIFVLCGTMCGKEKTRENSGAESDMLT